MIKLSSRATIRKVEKHVAAVHAVYAKRFAELLELAEAEKAQERERGH